MKYHGTKIDGPGFDPESLQVRGTDLNVLIAEKKFIDAVFHILTGSFPSTEEYGQLEAFFLASFRAVPLEHPLFTHIRQLSYITQNSIKGVIAGLLFDLDDICSSVYEKHPLPGLCSEKETAKGLFFIALLPLMLRASTDGKNNTITQPAATGAVSYTALAYKTLFSKDEVTENDLRIFEALLVAWHAGFGYLTPSVLAPRVIAGTGASANMIIMSGFIAGGPHHIGASEASFSLISGLASKNEAEIIRLAEDHILAKNIIPGFGHPLFKRDPRADCLKSIWMKPGIATQSQSVYKQVTSLMEKHVHIYPNIDFITAAILVDFGVTDASLIPGVGLFARSVAIIAHAAEKKQKPPFGTNSTYAKNFITNNRITELSFD